MQVSKIVRLSIITRVVVDSNADDVTITNAAMTKAHDLLNTHQGSLDLLDNIEDDVECPYDPSEDDKEEYYALFDYDTKEHLHTGYNARTQAELKEDLLSYLEADTSKKEMKKFKSMSVQEIAATKNMLVECQATPFDELNEGFGSEYQDED